MIIGIVGKARSGKDTFANMLAKELNKTSYPRYILMAFAHELKTRCQKDFNLTYEQLWGDDKEVPDERYEKPETEFSKFSSDPKEAGIGVYKYWTAREIMQRYGEFYRTIDNDFWVTNLFRVAEDKGYENVIITDVRYVNEADVVLERGGVLVRVTRENTPEIHGTQHISETALDDYDKVDFTVVNDWGLKELEHAAADVVRFMKEGILKNKFKEIN